MKPSDSHEHLNDFIQKRVSGRGKSSQASQRNNELIQAAAKAKDSNDFMVLAKISGYQANPLASTLEQRSLGLSKLKITQRQKEADEKLFRNGNDVVGDYQQALGIDATPQGRQRMHLDPDASSFLGDTGFGTLSPTRNGHASGSRTDPYSDPEKMK